MSKFLAPIHTWLFNKIVLLETIEKSIIHEFNSDANIALLNQLKETFGDFIPNLPLEDLIDQSNIHGWLQERINIAENRQAAFIHQLIEQSKDNLEIIKSVYFKEGLRQGELVKTTVTGPNEIFQALNNVLLEGMPCDRVNSVVEQSPDKIVWNTLLCVHKNNWESNQVNVEYYYDFRASFTKGFVEGINHNFTYIYTNDIIQQHQIIA